MRGGHDTRRAAEAIRHAEHECQQLLIEAAFLMAFPSLERKALALVKMALAMLRLAESDPSEVSMDLAVKKIRSSVRPSSHETVTA